MEFVLSLVILVVAIWIDWYIAKQFEAVATQKGHKDKKYFWICFLLAAVGYLLVIALPDRGNTQQAISEELPEL